MGPSVSAAFTQSAFRFRNDDGSQTSATWIAALNDNVERKPFFIFRLRLLIQQTVSTANANLAKAFKIRQSLNGESYVDVGAQGSTSTAVRMADSPNVVDNDATTQQIGSGSFITGSVEENNSTSTITFTTGALSETELEFVMEINGAQFSFGDFIDFRVHETNNTILNNYTVTPRLTRTRRFFVLG